MITSGMRGSFIFGGQPLGNPPCQPGADEGPRERTKPSYKTQPSGPRWSCLPCRTGDRNIGDSWRRFGHAQICQRMPKRDSPKQSTKHPKQTANKHTTQDISKATKRTKHIEEPTTTPPPTNQGSILPPVSRPLPSCWASGLAGVAALAAGQPLGGGGLGEVEVGLGPRPSVFGTPTMKPPQKDPRSFLEPEVSPTCLARY